MGLGSFDPGSSYYHYPLVYADRLRGLRVYNTRHLGDMVEVEMSDGNGYRLYRADFEEASRNGYFFNPEKQMYGSSGSAGGGAGQTQQYASPTKIQPGGTTFPSPHTQLVDEYKDSPEGGGVITFPVDTKPVSSEQKPRNTMKRVYYHNRLRKKS